MESEGGGGPNSGAMGMLDYCKLDGVLYYVGPDIIQIFQIQESLKLITNSSLHNV